MCGHRSEIAYVADMVEACERVLVFASGWSDSELVERDLPHRGAILHQLTILGEAAKYVTEATRERWTDIPWADIVGMRDKLVHYYHGLDDALLLGTVRASVPALLPQLGEMLAEMDAQNE